MNDKPTTQTDQNANDQAFAEAKRFFPGGVNSPVRAFKAVGGTPLFFEEGRGARVRDASGRWFIDLVGSWGPLLLGHAHPDVVAAVRDAATSGLSFGAPTRRETALAQAIVAAFPRLEKLRLVCSGTEATMAALRLARGYTGRPLIVKMAGCYHGHGDSLLVDAGSGVATFGIPGCAGVTAATAAETLVVPFNDLPALRALLERHPDKIAAVIVEPVPGNMGVVLPTCGYLEGVRALTKQYGVLLIFDEVMCGFRGSKPGAQDVFAVDPDLTCLGKVVGGGLPLAVYGGRAAIMDRLSPLGDVYQAGTLAGNPLAVSAGAATLRHLAAHPEALVALEGRAARLVEGLAQAAARHGVPAQANRYGTMFTVFFTDRPVSDYASAKTSDTKRFARFFHGMLAEGVYWAPSQFEAAFLSIAHGDAEIDAILAAADKVLPTLR